MTPRVKRLRDEMFEWKDSVCLHRPRIVTETYKNNESDPSVVKRAKALRDTLEQMPIYLREGDLIAGTPTSTPGAWIVYPEFSLGTEQIVQTRHNFNVGANFIKDALPEDIKEYWRTRNLYARYAAMRRECFGDRTPPPENWYQLSTALGHITPDFSEVLGGGLEGVIERAERRLKETRDQDPEGAAFLRAVVIASQGAIIFARRYAELAEDAARATTDPARRSELERMADGLRHAPAKGARTFWEALQSVWLCNQIMHIEGNAWSMSPGRVDQIFFPFFRRDVERGELTREQAFELVECFLIKFKENMVFGPRGNPTQCITLSGGDAQDHGHTNELSYLFIEAVRELKLPEPLVNVRWHRAIPADFMNACFDCLASGQGMPLFLNDEATPACFMDLGIAREAAYEYTHVGCGELGITGKLQDSALGGSTGNVAALVQLLREGRRDGQSLAAKFPTFDAFLDGLKEKMRANAERSAAVSRAVGHAQAQYGQIPFASALMHGCIERARDLTTRAEYNFPSMNFAVGFAVFVNSLSAIRHLAYRDRRCDLDALFDAMEADFQGHEDLLAACRRAPKFANDDPQADDLGPILERLHAAAIAGLKGPRNGGRFITSGIDGGGHITAGRNMMATPDGRRAGQPLSPGMGPARGTERNGLTAVLNSVTKLDAEHYWHGGYTVNLRMTPDVFRSAASRAKLMALMRAYFLRKGLNLHINCVSAETLRDALKDPQSYRDLVVRVSGYNDYFTMLSPHVQEEIIRRTEHGLEPAREIDRAGAAIQ